MAKKYRDSIFYDKKTVIGMDDTMITKKTLLEEEVNRLIHSADAKKGDDWVIEAEVTGFTRIGEGKHSVSAVIASFGSKQIECVIPESDFMDFPEFDEALGYGSEKKMHAAFLQSTQWAKIYIALKPPKPDPSNPGKMMNNIIIDEETGMVQAVCSRKIAMDRLYKEYWLPKTDGKRIINDGCLVMARVIRVANSCIFVECYGVEFQIPLRELSWHRLSYAQEAFTPGDVVKIMILDIQYSDDEENERPYVVASVKEANENPQVVAFPRVTTNNNYTGVVKNPCNGKFFVTLDQTDAEVLCDQGDYTVRTPQRGDKCVVRIDGKSEDTLRIWGTIVRLEQKKISRPKFIV